MTVVPVMCPDHVGSRLEVELALELSALVIELSALELELSALTLAMAKKTNKVNKKLDEYCIFSFMIRLLELARFYTCFAATGSW